MTTSSKTVVAVLLLLTKEEDICLGDRTPVQIVRIEDDRIRRSSSTEGLDLFDLRLALLALGIYLPSVGPVHVLEVLLLALVGDNTGTVLLERLVDGGVGCDQTSVATAENDMTANQSSDRKRTQNNSRAIELDNISHKLCVDEQRVALRLRRGVVLRDGLEEIVHHLLAGLELVDDLVELKRRAAGQNDRTDDADNTRAEEQGGGLLLHSEDGKTGSTGDCSLDEFKLH